MLHRAYSLLEIKSIDDEQRIITGIASTPTPDRYGDIVEPKGAEFTLPIPLLWQHRSSEPIGEVFDAKVTANGIEIKARLAKIDEPGKLKERIDESWQSLKARLVRGLSIGFSSIEYSRIENGGLRFLKWAWLELSCVTIPANQEATIQAVKSYASAALGTEVPDPARKTTPGATGRSAVVKAITRDTHMKTIAEQIKDFENTRAAKSAEMTGIMQKAADAGTTLDTAEAEKYDGLKAEVKSIDDHLARLRDHEEVAKAAAVPAKGDDPADASKSRGGVITVKQNLPPGIAFARMAMCIAVAKGNPMQALEIAKHHYPDMGNVHQFMKAAVGAATTGNHQGPDLQYTDFLGDFIDYLRPGSILGKFGTNGIPALRRVPFNSRIASQTAGGSASWVGQGLPKPLTKGTFTTVTLDFMKLACISVLTQEEVRFASPSAEQKVRDDIAAAINARMDIDFVDPANAGTANVKPASITNGVVATAVSGATASALRVDFKNLLSGFVTNNIDVSSLVLIMPAQMALNISLMQNALGQTEHPNLTMKGGTLFGIPVIVSEHLTSVGSPSTGTIIAVSASDIFLADDGGVSIDASSEASLEMLDGSLTQDGTAGTGASLVSLWQNNLLGLRAERFVTWKKRRDAAAAYLSPAAYSPA